MGAESSTPLLSPNQRRLPDRLYRVHKLLIEKGWLHILSHRALCIHLVLLDHFNWKRRVAYPSYDTLHRKTGFSDSTIREALKELAFDGLWEIHHTTLPGKGKGRVRRVNVYRLPASLVPDPPPQPYVSPDKYTRKGRLPALRVRILDTPVPYRTDEATGVPRSSRALGVRSSRALKSDRFGALEQNNEVNHEDKPRITPTPAPAFHLPQATASPNGEEPRKEQIIDRWLNWLRRQGGDHPPEPLVVAVSKMLARELCCDEDEARALLEP